MNIMFYVFPPQDVLYFENRRCNERDELVKKNDTKDKSLSALSEQVAQLTQELYHVNLSLQT